ncbi:hypothetical protein [Ktedonobacter robiniae]|uniref:Uncharacterized protein n=1 Tax=Ktedonobacter robiniae TaxID=2778365 RepID=A0ABQ3UPS2_9CHLR|nr:hypothetical protein [Ktedonobacter robiniae]GHO54357.1 hypothetical protein KSB_28320 [Ktedonobacter robiniae]
MINFATKRSNLLLTGLALGATAMATTLVGYVRREVQRRGYPSWEECQCDFKAKQAFFQVFHSRHQWRGATIVTQEWGAHLVNPAPWLRRLLHHGSQALAVLNMGNHYVERVTLSPQEAHQFVYAIQGKSMGEQDDESQEIMEKRQLIWRREVLHVPSHPFDAYVHRLYPLPVTKSQQEISAGLPVLWDRASDTPITVEGTLLDTPLGTRIDYIGWTPSQVAYCTARLESPQE